MTLTGVWVDCGAVPLENRTMRTVMNSGILAIGAVVGMTSTASAGLTWDVANANNSVQAIFGSEEPVTFSGAAAMSAVSASFGSDSASVTAATASGFSASLSYAVGAGDGAYLSLVRYFTVTGSADIQISGNSPSSDGIWRIYNSQGGEVIEPIDVLEGTSYSRAFSLVAGQYAVEMSTTPGTEYGSSGTFGNFTIVPAPGAVALLGAAGLIGSRRRR